MKLAAAALVLSFLVLPAMAHAHEGMMHDGCPADQSFVAGDITVSAAYSRAMLPNAPVGAGYMTISNAGASADRLVGATTEATPTVEIHNMSIVDGMMEMEALPDGIEIAAGGKVTLAPDGLHLMFMQPKAPFNEGECVEVTLTFEQAGPLSVQLSVGPIGADAPPDHSGHTM